MDNVKKPVPMTSPCNACPIASRCRDKRPDEYRCNTYRRAFAYAWDQTCAFLREQIKGGGHGQDQQ